MPSEPLLRVENLRKSYPAGNSFLFKKSEVHAVNDISFELCEGQTFGLVGESGCGKSTTGRTIIRLTEPSGGKVIYRNQNIFALKEKEFRAIRRDMQMIFQDPLSSLDPKRRIGYSLEEPLLIQNMGSRKDRRDRVLELLEKVGLSKDHYDKFPHEFSGGQRQRIGIARALVLNPKFIVCDEPVSALDVSIQAQIINLLKKLQADLGLSYLFISHDLSVVRYIADHIGVMYQGKIVERAPTDELFKNPTHSYTRTLLSAVPIPNPELRKKRVKGGI